MQNETLLKSKSTGFVLKKSAIFMNCTNVFHGTALFCVSLFKFLFRDKVCQRGEIFNQKWRYKISSHNALSFFSVIFSQFFQCLLVLKVYDIMFAVIYNLKPTVKLILLFLFYFLRCFLDRIAQDAWFVVLLILLGLPLFSLISFRASSIY